MLELAFATKELRTLCEDSACALETYGPTVASALWARLADLRAASNPLDLPFEVSRGTGSDVAHLIVALAQGYVLVLAANHPKPPVAADGSMTWERVSRVIILRLEQTSG